MVASQTKSPYRDERVERWLADRGVKFTFVEDVPLDNVDAEASLRNQARIGTAVIPARIEIMTEAAKNGAVFPAPVAYTKANKLVMIDGNHRFLVAREMKETSLPGVYVVDPKTPFQTLQKLTYEANNTHGMPNTQEDRLRHAIHLIALGSSQVEAAALVSLPLKDVRKEFGKLEADRRASAIGIKLNQWRKFSIASKLRLNAIRNDQVLVNLVNTIHAVPLSAQDINNLVTEINAFRSDKARLEFIKDDLPVRYRNVDEKIYRRSVRTVFSMQARGLLRCLKEQADELSKELSDLDKDELKELSYELIVSLDAFTKTL